MTLMTFFLTPIAFVAFKTIGMYGEKPLNVKF